MFCLIPEEDFKCKESLVTEISAPNFVSSIFKASNRSVSLIFSVCNPVKSQAIPNPKEVTAMV